MTDAKIGTTKIYGAYVKDFKSFKDAFLIHIYIYM